MSVLSQLELLGIYHREIAKTHGCAGAALQAVAEAAIAADRAARAEPVASLAAALIATGKAGTVAAPPAAPVVPEDMSPANVPMYWRDESSNACAYAAGWNACRTTMLAAAPAPSQEPKP